MARPLEPVTVPRARTGWQIPWRKLHCLLVVIGTVGALVALLAYGFTRDPRAIPSPLVGRPAPTFSLALLGGGSRDFATLHGRVVVVNFWASSSGHLGAIRPVGTKPLPCKPRGVATANAELSW